jgi:flagellar hook protein FlgE
MGFGQGLSGLNAAAQNLDVIGNNIANSGTVGFKAGSATFADVYASSRVGLGVQVASVSQRFTTGTVSSTGNQFDMAIDGANGLFVVTQPSGATLYTRNGQFIADKNNKIVNTQGQQLMGYAPGGTTLIGMTVPTGNIDPQATSAITNTVNLDANALVVPKNPVVGQVVLTSGGVPSTYYYTVAAGTYTWTDSAGAANPALAPADGSYTTGSSADPVTITAGQPAAAFPAGGGNVAYAPAVPFDPNDAASFSNMTPVTVYDSLGNAHSVQQYYTKREPSGGNSVWEVNYVVDGVPPTPPANQATLAFDNAGRLVSGSPATITFTPGGTTSPAAPLAIKVAYDGSTQFGGGFSQNFIQNGYATGEYASMSIGTNGELIANYTNGVTKTIGTLALANFNNLQGLQPVGGNAWAETANSGQPILGTPGSNGLATIKGQSVEESNVDMSQELVNMIIAQRTYQANAETIKTQDQILQTLISMR